MMGKQRMRGSSHELLKAKAKDRVDDLQGVFGELQTARRENRSSDVAVLEEQVNQMLREWKAELHEPSPCSSLLVTSPATSELSSDMKRLLQLTEEDDDATSNLAAYAISQSEQQPQHLVLGTQKGYQQGYAPNEVELLEDEMLARLISSDIVLADSPPLANEESLAIQAQLRSPQLSLHEAFSPGIPPTGFCATPHEDSSLFFKSRSNTPPPPLAFLGPKCALWDCPRPAHGSDWHEDYCSTFHASLAVSEGASGMPPVVRPGGIDLKDGPLFSALFARSQNKAVGIPQCEGAATSKSPWNATELFDTSILLGESLREWLFFDKSRRAFESGTRKQRSLPDYTGRGWHESRKQAMKDAGGLKRSYYMDPQPDTKFEWHLYEYELSDFDAWALYRLELKQVSSSKKNTKAKGQNGQVTALQDQIGRLAADLSIHDGKVWAVSLPEAKGNTKSRTKSTQRSNNRSSNFVATQISPVVDDHAYVDDTSFSYMLDVNDYLFPP